MLRIVSHRLRVGAPLALLVWLSPGMGASAAESTPPAGAKAAAAETKAPVAEPKPSVADSPRAALDLFLTACREGRFEDAGKLLEVSVDQVARRADLARRLKQVLDAHVWLELDLISNSPGGNREDGLPPQLEQVGEVPGRTGAGEPVQMVRKGAPGQSRWMFNRATVDRIDDWSGQLRGRWWTTHLPAPLLRVGPAELLWWQWLGVPLLCVLAWAVGSALGVLTGRLLRRLVARTRARWDDELLKKLPGPLRLAWALAILYLTLPLLGLLPSARQWAFRALVVGSYIAFFWALMRGAEVAGRLMLLTPWASSRPASRSLLLLLMRTGKIVLLAIAAVVVLSELGYSVTSLIAGLGIGGLALALAAQKTVENVFGSFSIGLDQPFRVGDYIKVEDVAGTVETIGLRSTRIRTLDRTLITVPNGKLADLRIESFAVRDRMRLSSNLVLAYGARSEQVRQVLDGIERLLRSHEKIWPDAVVVRLGALGESGFNIDVMAWFQTPDFSEFQLIRQQVLLSMVEVIERAGARLAHPTRTIRMVQEQDNQAEHSPSSGVEVGVRPDRNEIPGDRGSGEVRPPR